MQITQTKTEGLIREFKVVVPTEEIAKKLDARLRELGKKVKMPGFRPGHVPLPLLKQRYAASVKGEVLEKVIEEGTKELMKSQNLRAALQPKIDLEPYKDGGSLEYKVAVELLPEIEPVDLAKLKFERLKAAVEPIKVDEALKRIAESSRELKPADTKAKAKKGSTLHISFHGTIEGKEIKGGSSDGTDLELGSGSFIPGFEDQLIGSKAGDKKEVKVNFPDDYHAKELAGKPAVFDVEVKEIKEAFIPEIDDALAQKLGMKDLEGLRKAIEDQIAKDYDSLSFLHAKRTILDKLADKFEFPIPQGLVDLEFESIWAQLESERPKDEAKSEKEDKKLREQYRAIAERRVRLGLLLAEIGRENKVTVPPRELEHAIIQEARRYQGQEQKVFEYYRNNPNAQATLRAPLFEDKVIELILQKAQVAIKEVKFEELQERVKEITEGEEL